MSSDPPTVEVRSVPSGDSAVPVTQVGRAGPAVVTIPSIFGVGDDLIEQMQEIAAAGGQAWAPDPFFRNDPGVKPFVPSDAAFARIKTLDREQCLADMQAVFAVAKAAAGHGFSHRQSPAFEPNAERAGLDDVLARVRALSGT